MQIMNKVGLAALLHAKQQQGSRSKIVYHNLDKIQ